MLGFKRAGMTAARLSGRVTDGSTSSGGPFLLDGTDFSWSGRKSAIAMDKPRSLKDYRTSNS